MSKIVNYIEETYEELVHRVTWPTWSELQSTALIVLVASVIFSLLIFAMDFVFGANASGSFWGGLLQELVYSRYFDAPVTN